MKVRFEITVDECNQEEVRNQLRVLLRDHWWNDAYDFSQVYVPESPSDLRAIESRSDQ